METSNPFHIAHKQSDVDAEPSSQHHTLGRGPNQAAHGNHGHEFTSPNSTPPDRPAVGDVWIVTDMDNLRRRWNGTAWVDELIGDMALGNITADSISAGAIDGQTINGAVFNAGEIYGSYISANNIQGGTITGTDITGVDIVADTFKSSNSSQRVEIGNVGGGDPVDEIRMWNGGTVVSMRNFSSDPGTIFFSANSNARVHFDGIYAKDFIPNSLRAYKDNIESVQVDHVDILKRNGLKKWEWNDEFFTKDPDPGNPGKSRKPPKNRNDRVDYGLIADDMPNFMRKGDGYSLPTAVGFLWDALSRAMDRIEELERRIDGNA